MLGVPGQNAPWSVGSVFTPPQLLTSDLGPIFFNPLGKPQRLLSTGHRLEQFETSISVREQVENFLEIGVPFISRDLLQDHIEAEESLNEAFHTYGTRFLSNRLQGLKCNAGQVLLLFISGKGATQVASTVYYSGTSLRQTGSSQFCSDFKQTGWSVSPALKSSIHQLSAVWANSTDNGGQECAVVAARTIYSVHFYTVSIERDCVQLMLTAVSNFQVPSTHVTWNPFVSGEAAVILESGAVCLFDVQASKPGNPVRVVDLTAKLILESPAQRVIEGPSSELNGVKCSSENLSNDDEQQIWMGGDVLELQELEKTWWRCEFAWLPQTLLVVNSQDVFLVDLRKDVERNPTCRSSGRKTVDGISSLNGIDVIATARTSLSSRFSSLKPRKENILAFTRADGDEMYKFAVATEFRLMLFDTRQPQIPILQWEHGMQQEPPNLLIMCPLSRLRSVVEEKGKHGKAILAVSFKSGDMRVFCYGQDLSVWAPLSNNLSRQRFDIDNWSSATYAWEIPSRLNLPQTDGDDWREVLSSSKGPFSKKSHGKPKLKEGLPNIAGLILLSGHSQEPTLNKRNKTFTFIQLTGLGQILAQTYQASDKIQYPLQASISNVGNTFVGEHTIRAQGNNHQDLKFEVLPCLLQYSRAGSILHPYRKNFEESGKQGTSKHADDETQDTYQDGTYPKTINSLGIGTREKSATMTSTFNENLYQEGMEALLKAFIWNMNFPLSIYEVAKKVLTMRLPEKLLPLAAGMPSDLDASGYKFPLVSRLLCSMTKGCKSANPKPESQSVDAALLSNNTSNTGLEGKVPLPLLLEICNLDKSFLDHSLSKGGEIEATDTSICEEDPNDADMAYGNQLRFEGGHKLLLEGCQYLAGVIEELVSKTEPNVIPLSQDTQDVLGNSNGEGCSDSHIILYRILGRESILYESGPTEFSVSGVGASTVKRVAQHAVDEMKDPAVHKDIYRKFIAQKVASQTLQRPMVKQSLKIDPSLCPVQLNFTAGAEEELEDGELIALESMQMDFLQWQQSFTPYKSSY